MLVGTHYSDLAIVCNVNNSPKLVPTGRNWARLQTILSNINKITWAQYKSKVLEFTQQ